MAAASEGRPASAVDRRELDQLVAGEHGDPHRAPRPATTRVVRAYRPDAVAMRVGSVRRLAGAGRR